MLNDYDVINEFYWSYDDIEWSLVNAAWSDETYSSKLDEEVW